MQLAELSFRTPDGATVRFDRASTPTAEQQGLLETLGWPVPHRYLPPDLVTDSARLQ